MTEPSFEVLSGDSGGDALPAERPYGGALRFPDDPRPYVVVNFVATIDGVASLGITDGTYTELVGGDLQEESEVVTGITGVGSSRTTAAAAAGNPLLGQQQNQRGGGPGGFGGGGGGNRGGR